MGVKSPAPEGVSSGSQDVWFGRSGFEELSALVSAAYQTGSPIIAWATICQVLATALNLQLRWSLKLLWTCHRWVQAQTNMETRLRNGDGLKALDP